MVLNKQDCLRLSIARRFPGHSPFPCADSWLFLAGTYRRCLRPDHEAGCKCWSFKVPSVALKSGKQEMMSKYLSFIGPRVGQLGGGFCTSPVPHWTKTPLLTRVISLVHSVLVSFHPLALPHLLPAK